MFDPSLSAAAGSGPVFPGLRDNTTISADFHSPSGSGRDATNNFYPPSSSSGSVRASYFHSGGREFHLLGPGRDILLRGSSFQSRSVMGEGELGGREEGQRRGGEGQGKREKRMGV